MQTEGAVICLGEALFDQVVDGSGHQQNYPGGAPANVAVALARLGLPAEFVGCLGDDAQGETLIEVLRHKGVGCQGIQRQQKPTRIVEVRCSASGDRTFGGFIGGSTTDFADAHLSAQKLPVALFQKAQGLVTGTLGLAYPETQAAMEHAATLVKAGGGQVVIDLNWRPTFWPRPQEALEKIQPWLAAADWIKLSTEEAIELFGTAELGWLAQRFNLAQGILVTDGEQGCKYIAAGQTGSLPAFLVTSQDTTGAGDAFLAGFIYQLSKQGWQVGQSANLKKMLTFASALGALTTLKPGAIAAQPSLEQLFTFLNTHTGDTWTT